ncbi:hypothetical protein [Glaciihabitans sp. dw_435]|uniref:hypothetical protein n=1 Tax=Glaciihabitans sp. dw_435 TaxID=2720081 RepID=UPI001BD4E5A9|nr:hypothetical protein [Glaciihabitans sp. dw_435]
MDDPVAAQRARLFAVALALVAATSLSGCVTIVQAPPDPSPKPNVVGRSADAFAITIGDWRLAIA